MIGRKSLRVKNVEMPLKLKGFDDFDVRLGDLMRGERATLGKSLVDVQNDLKINAMYIAGVEDANPLVFDTPGFIAGYVRSYAKYLGMDPENAFVLFCEESGFKPIHGMSINALPKRPTQQERLATLNLAQSGGFAASKTPFAQPTDSFLSGLDVKATLSSLVLVSLLGSLGYGAYSIVHKIQMVQMVPIEQSPLIAPDLVQPMRSMSSDLNSKQNIISSENIYNRIYRPQALDVPILTPRDSPISSLDPNSRGMFSLKEATMGTIRNTKFETGQASVVKTSPRPGPKVVEAMPYDVQLVAEKGVWLRVKDADGSVIYEQVMDAQDPFKVPLKNSPVIIERAGNSGALFFLVNGELYGPAGNGASTVKNIELSPENLIKTYDIHKPDQQSSFYSFLRDLEADSLMH